MDKTLLKKVGIGAVMIGVLSYTISYLFKQVRLLVKTDFVFSGTQLNSVSLEKVSITLWWEVVNKSDISFTISNQEYDIFVNGRFIKKVGYSSPVEIKPKEKTKIPVYVVLTLQDLKNIGLQNIVSLLTEEGRKNLNLKVQGKFTIKTSIFEVKKFPFEYEENLDTLTKYN